MPCACREQRQGDQDACGSTGGKLLPPALEALQAQKVFTFLEGARVFQCPSTNRPWLRSQHLWAMWQGLVKRAGVRYRPPYQMRHTYACMMLSRGENPLWVASQMGHKAVQMIFKVYGKSGSQATGRRRSIDRIGAAC